MSLRDLEQQEMKRAIELLGGSTRHARLLQFLGSRHFDTAAPTATEFDIATEVFGRALESFDPSEDAVVRVEAHRLRKKLREIYEKDQRPDGIRISLPAGTYVLKFTPGSEPQSEDTEPDSNSPRTAAPAVGGEQPPTVDRTGRRIPKWAVIFFSLAAAGVIAIAVMTNHDSRRAQTVTPQPPRTESPERAPAAEGEVSEVHLLAGYSGSETIDSSGVRWTPDRFYVSGGAWSRDNGFVRGTSRSFLYSNWRTGEFGYNIPLARGSYELRMYLVSPNAVGDEKLSGFNVALNGAPLLNAYDVIMSANGVDVADEQVFRDITPGADGFLRLWFSNQVGTPMLNALELVPGTPGKLKPIRILMQPTSFVDHRGQRWRADDYYLGGFSSTARTKVKGTEDPELFAAERFGRFRYAIPVDRRGRYTVVLHFAEFYYGPQLKGGGGIGQRVFHVYCNGKTLLRDFDIFKEAGSLMVISKSFQHLEPSAQGKLNLDFEPVINNATVSGIEVLDESP